MEVKEKLCEKVWNESSLVCALGVGAVVGSLVMAVIVLIVT
jgi:hypothetical protein